MADVELYLFDDKVAREWQPFALTRPIGELLYGAYTFRARAEQLCSARCAGHITSPHLAGFDEPGSAPVIDLERVGTTVTRIFLSSRADLGALSPDVLRDTKAATLQAAGHTIGCILPPTAANPSYEWFLAPTADLPGAEPVDIEARVIDHVWDLIESNSDRLIRDYEQLPAGAPVGPTSFDAIAFRSGMLRVGENVVIEPNVVFDFSHGPIRLDDNVTVRAFTRLAGPAYVGPRSTLLGGPYETVSIGPVCRVHGEVEESIVLGWSNKAHDGFLGHAILGRWVNLGAMTTNSDLKNNYHGIRMWTPNGDMDTGTIKLGCLLGDHVKTAIGSLINTGTVIGAGTNIFGAGMPPKYVPPFSWGNGDRPYEIDRFLEVTTTVMQRRGIELSEGMRNVLRAAWEIARQQAPRARMV